MCPSENYPGVAISVAEELDEHGGTIKRIMGVDISNDNVTAATLARGYTAHDGAGNLINGQAQICKELVGEISMPVGILELEGEILLPETQVLPPEYDGSYEITPQAYDEITLPTSGCYLKDDVVVLEIPYYTTTNVSGGYTAIIGG